MINVILDGMSGFPSATADGSIEAGSAAQSLVDTEVVPFRRLRPTALLKLLETAPRDLFELLSVGYGRRLY